MRNLGGHLPATSLPLLSFSQYLSVIYLICIGVWVAYSILNNHKLIVVHYFLIIISVFLFLSQITIFLALRFFHIRGSIFAELQYLSLILQSLVTISFQSLLLLVSWGYSHFAYFTSRLGITREAVGEHIYQLLGFDACSLFLLFFKGKIEFFNDSIFSFGCICGCLQQSIYIIWFFRNIQLLHYKLEAKHQYKKLELVRMLQQILFFSIVYAILYSSMIVSQLVSENKDRFWQQRWL